MKRMKYIFICLIFGMLVLTGCQKNDEKIVEGTGVFYLNTEGTGLVKEAYRIKGTNTEEQIKELLMELQKETDCIDFVSVIPVGVEIEKIVLTSLPDKLELIEGQELDLTGMVVTAVMNNGFKNVIAEGYTVSGYSNVPGTYEITIAYREKTATFNVTVAKKK